MTLRHHMIQTIAKAPALLENATDRVVAFVIRQQNEDGGFRGRHRDSDLYYTVFGLELLIALEDPVSVDLLQHFLKPFDQGQTLDLVHLASLARCWANLADLTGWPIETQLRDGMTQRLLDLQSEDGGFNTLNERTQGNAYGCFLALGMSQDLELELLDPQRILHCVESLLTPDGGFTHDATSTAATTPATAAALCVYHMLDRSLPETAVTWLSQRRHAQGGFGAIAADSPLCLPDLLSTATALHALSYSHPFCDSLRERHLDFLDSLWNPQGGFSASWADATLDCEYTYYGLLALGHLAEM